MRDAAPDAAIEAITGRELGEVRGLQGINELGGTSFRLSAALGNWTIALAPMASPDTDDALMVPFPVGREALTRSSNVAAAASFILWQDGVRTVDFDPHLRLDPISEAWMSRMREVGLDPEGEGPSADGKFHFVEASFAMAANYTGVQITSEFLSMSTFVAGSDD